MKTGTGFAWIILILAVGMVIIGLWLSKPLGLLLSWALVALLMLVALGITGLSLGKGVTGILIDPLTNMMSLSRLQIVLWMWVVLSAFITLAAARVWDEASNPTGYQCPVPPAGQEAACADPLGIQLPPLLWALLGISMTSAVGAPLLKAAKAQRTADQDTGNEERALRRNGSKAAAPTYHSAFKLRAEYNDNLADEFGDAKPLGALVRRDSPGKAAFSDVFTGEEVATFGYVDIAKVQNLFFSVIAVVAYSVSLAAVMATNNVAQLFAFPDPTAGLVAVIGISHSGYLVDKAVTHSVPEEETPPNV